MANRYWVNGTGNWPDNINHWSDTSGGSAGASLPTSADNVYFDGNSFTAIGQTVTVNTTANCLDMDWTGALHSPTLTGGSTLSIFGSLILISTITVTLTQKIIFASTLSGNNITTAGVFLPCSIDFNGTGGEWILQDDITITALYGAMGIYRGTLNTNSKTITVFSLVLNGSSSARGLNLSSSDIVLSGHFSNSSTVGLTFNAGTSTIKLTGNSKTFAGGGLTYNNVEFQGTPTTITDSNTFNQLKVNAGKTAKLTAGTTQTITSLLADGATIQSATAGTPATIATPNDDIVVRAATIQDITAPKPIYALKNSVNVSGNTGVMFTDKVFRGNIGAVKCATAGRPIANLLIGMMYYDTTLNKPIWYKGDSIWVDATGTTA